ncbi:HD domain-containing protein [Ruminiclostridium herbifermentans]|uniref:HD domain-containing protein n=1 Tax=Ruminiclostridium herbifermentans TaxID=2488810 RepID=A0A4U7JGJ1_9FIRM|nr:HD domain-containing protein [Ruminiclostridium herbifermentans]QNU67028.1 HD domain-containing protein [Ruminiclostridium herbifermentans]
MANEKCIRDPIHNYIYLTDVEFKLIKHPLFQRLRFITQNGAAYYTYPSNRNCRFLHSLGCMKLGGDIFLYSTENLSDNDVKEYLKQSYKMLENIATDNLTTPISDITKEFISTKDKTFDKYGLSLWINKSSIENEMKKEVFQMQFARAVLFQSVRLACILHDIGHFPFSHAVERAFSQYLDYLNPRVKESDDIYIKYNSKVKYVEKQIHERIGLGILQEIIPSNEKDFHKLCRHLARIILIGSHTEYNNIVHPLHTIISSELDSDRLDYSLRDPRSSGLELGAFDIERLISNFTIVREGEKFEILPKVNALSSIESFYHQRFLTYKYLIYHHSKARMDEIVKEITVLLVEIHNSKDYNYDSIKKVLEDYNFNYLWEKCDTREYYYCNENWYFTILQGIYIIIQSNNIDDKTTKLKVLIETFIFRKTENIYSFFKRYDTYFNFMERMYIKINQLKNIEFDDFEKKMRGVINDSINNNALKELNDKLYKEDNVICLITKTDPKVIKFLKNQQHPPTSELNVVQHEKNGEKKKVPITVFSPYLQSMGYASEKEQFFNVFIIKEDIKADIEKGLLEKIKEEFINFFVCKYKEVL